MNLALQSVGRRSVKMLYPNACFQPRGKVAMLVEKMIYIYIYIYIAEFLKTYLKMDQNIRTESWR